MCVSLTCRRYHDRPVRCSLPLSLLGFPGSIWRLQGADFRATWNPACCRGKIHFLEEGRGHGRASLAGFSRGSVANSTKSSQIELVRRTLELCGGLVAPAWTGIASPSNCRCASALAETPGTRAFLEAFPSMSSSPPDSSAPSSSCSWSALYLKAISEGQSAFMEELLLKDLPPKSSVSLSSCT